VNQEVEASADGEAELAFREQEFSEGVCIGQSKDGASQAAPGSTDADGSNFFEVLRVLVKGEKTTEGE
jgi:hypothetical protein